MTMRYIPRGEPLTPPPELGVDEVNKSLEGKDAEEVVKWAVDRFGSDRLVVTTSFGIQSAVMLHMVSEIVPNVTVVWVDTGYFPPETYRYAEQLCDRLQIRLKIYQSELSPARMEAIYGKLWDNQDIESLKLYNRIRKVEPLHRAFNELQCQVWLTGVRRSQTEKRATLSTFDVVDSRAKVMPLLEWSCRDVAAYLKKHNLPKHPLEEKGYVSVGDWHSSRPITLDDLNDRDTRFFGLFQECGIHE